MSNTEHDAALTELSFTVSGYISKPAEQTYEAVADPEQLSHYFTTGGAQGRLTSDTTVTWDFADFPGAFPVRVVEATPSKKIVIEWESGESAIDGAASNPGHTRVVFEFEPIDDNTRTLVTITESSWTASADGSKAAFNNCLGWTGMLAALKVWIEHGINLREGFYK